MSAEDGKKTGDGSGVGLFIPLPQSLGRWFPSRAPHDNSVPHVTFLYIGDVPAERVDLFSSICRKALSHLTEVRASLGPLGYFEKEEFRVAFRSVNFDHEMAHARREVWRRLEEAGFEVADSFPEYHPHTTLAYLEGHSQFDGPLPEGSWSFDEIEVWGFPSLVRIPLGDNSETKVAHRWLLAKGKYKSKTEDSEGNTQYEYGPRQLSKRDKEKAERVESLRHKIDDLRKRVKSDLSAKDENTKQNALAVALMDATYERVGNDESAKDGHFGVTGWQVRHVTFKGRKALIKYVGKSGVSHTKEVTDASLVSALKSAVKGKSGEDDILSVEAKDVNAYLKPYDVTAKDIRGFHANLEMQSALESVRKKGPTIPHARKDKDKILKAEFEKALEIAAKAVGHEPATLKSNYLVPGFSEAYIHDGTVLQKFEKQATKSVAEREDDEAARLSRPSPKKKPPRKDKRRNRVHVDEDKDVDTGDRGDDPDLSRNYKRVGSHKKSQCSLYSSPVIYGRVVKSDDREPGSPSPGALLKAPTAGRDHLSTTRRAKMPRKLTKKGAQEVTASLERIAELMEKEHHILGVPERVAMDMALRLDLLCDHLDRQAGIMPSVPETDGFDPTEIAQKETGALKGDSDEPYMKGNFTEGEHSELREKQEGGGIATAERRAALDALVKTGASANAIVAFLKLSGEVEEEEEEEEEDDSKEEEDDSKEETSKKASSHGFNLFA